MTARRNSLVAALAAVVVAVAAVESQAQAPAGSASVPAKITHVDPVYPELARQARVQGIVIVQVTVGTDGRVSNARVIRSIPLLDAAALDAVRQWVYEPVKAPATLTVTVPFGVAASPAAVAAPPVRPAPASPSASAAPPQPATTAPAAIPSASAAPAPAAAAAGGGRTACDDLAAHPDDDNKVAGAAGVTDEAIAGERAIAACVQAVQGSPQSGRLHFQLGRAYWAAKRRDEAIESLLAAEERGYAPAYFYLAEAYDYGLMPGEKADAALATALYALAAEGGFLPAIAMLGYDSTGATPGGFDAAGFARPAQMKALHDGDLAALERQDRFELLTYLQGFHALLSETPNEYDSSCPMRSERRVAAALDRKRDDAGWAYVFSAGRPALDARWRTLDSIRQDGIDDSYLLITEFGGCTGPAFQKVYAAIERMVQ